MIKLNIVKIKYITSNTAYKKNNIVLFKLIKGLFKMIIISSISKFK